MPLQNHPHQTAANRQYLRRRPQSAREARAHLSPATLTPPFAVPSSFVSTTPAKVRSFHRRLLPAQLRSARWLHQARAEPQPEHREALCRLTLRIFASSVIRFFLLCSLPAVSQMRISQFFALNDAIASNTTAAGSAPLAVLNDRNTGAFSPNCELLCCGCAEGVAGGKHHGTSVRFVHCGKFAD